MSVRRLILNSELNLYEDIYSPIVSGDITLTDTVGLIESFPIIGEEILDVSFSTAGAALPPTAGPSAVGSAPPASEAPKQVMNRFRVYSDIIPGVPYRKVSPNLVRQSLSHVQTFDGRIWAMRKLPTGS